MPKPYRQGQLDGLCGVYALINAVDVLCGPLNKRQAQALFLDILSFLESRGSLAERCVHGVAIHDIAAILKHVICSRYPIVRSKPFHRCKRVDLALYLQSLTAFLAHPRTVAFVAIEGHYNHWTLVSNVTDKSIVLHDSDQMHFLLRSSCSMQHAQDQKRHWLLPTHTYLLKRKP